MTQAEFDNAKPNREEKEQITSLTAVVAALPETDITTSDIYNMLNDFNKAVGTDYLSTELRDAVQTQCLAFKTNLTSALSGRETTVDAAFDAL